MNKINYKSGTLFLKSVSTSKIPLCLFVAKAAERFGSVTEVSLKGVFSHFRFHFLFWTFCFVPEHVQYLAKFDIDPETCELKNYRSIPLKVADQWFSYGR